MEVSRRIVLTGLGAVAAVAAMPIAIVQAAPLAAPPADVVPAASKGWWGFSVNDEYWHGPFDTRAQALAEAQSDYPDEGCTTGLCIPHEMDVPDLREMFVEWLCDGRDHFFGGHFSLFDKVAQAFEGANEDHDYEGEVGDELARADWKPLLADLRDIFAVALFRHGRPGLISHVMTETRRVEPLVDDDDPLLDALGADDAFATELTLTAEAWLVAQNLKDTPQRLDIENEECHAAIEPGDGEADA